MWLHLISKPYVYFCNNFPCSKGKVLNIMSLLLLTYFCGKQYRANHGCWIHLLSADRILDNSYKLELCMSGKKPHDS